MNLNLLTQKLTFEREVLDVVQESFKDAWNSMSEEYKLLVGLDVFQQRTGSNLGPGLNRTLSEVLRFKADQKMTKQKEVRRSVHQSLPEDVTMANVDTDSLFQ